MILDAAAPGTDLRVAAAKALESRPDSDVVAIGHYGSLSMYGNTDLLLEGWTDQCPRVPRGCPLRVSMIVDWRGTRRKKWPVLKTIIPAVWWADYCAREAAKAAAKQDCKQRRLAKKMEANR